MDKVTTVALTAVRFQKASPMPPSKGASTHAVTEDPAWSVLSTNQRDKVVVRVVTRKTRLRHETTTTNDP